MSVDKVDLKKKLSKILNEIELPDYCKKYNWHHHSPSQINKPDDRWGYEYLYLNEVDRQKMIGNSKMEAGSIIGQAIAHIFADKIYDRKKKQYFEKKNDGKIIQD